MGKSVELFLIMEGEVHRTTWADFVHENELSVGEQCDHALSLMQHGVYTGGGGAQPVYVLQFTNPRADKTEEAIAAIDAAAREAEASAKFEAEERGITPGRVIAQLSVPPGLPPDTDFPDIAPAPRGWETAGGPTDQRPDEVDLLVEAEDRTTAQLIDALTWADIKDAAYMDSADDAARAIQERINVTDGGIAGLHLNEDAWQAGRPLGARMRMLTDWLDHEKSAATF